MRTTDAMASWRRRVLPVLLWLAACGPEPTGASSPPPAAPVQQPLTEPPAPTPAADPPTAPATAAPPLTAAQQATLARAKSRAQAFGKALKTTLKSAIEKQGMAGAFDVCASEAQRLTADAQGDDVALGRSSLRLRNPKNRAPAWVQTQLDAWGERSANGLTPEVVRTDKDVRLMIPIPVEGVCLNCHGPPTALQPQVRALIDKHYPEDRATGYAAGDLRGVLWAIARTEAAPAATGTP